MLAREGVLSLADSSSYVSVAYTGESELPFFRNCPLSPISKLYLPKTPKQDQIFEFPW